MKLLSISFIILYTGSTSAWFSSKKEEKPKEGDVKLFDGKGTGSGRVEVYHGGKWGSICDDFFDINAATVVCKQLGLKGGTPKWHSYYGSSKGAMLLGRYKCSGKEDKLVNCKGVDWKSHGCTHKNDAGVVCQGATGASEGDIRLSSKMSGHVQIFHNGEWGSVCSMLWGTREASVVCRQLGFSGVGAEVEKGKSGKGRLWLANPECTGSETRLSKCKKKGWTGSGCSHSADVGVKCKAPPKSSTSQEEAVRLSGGSATSGRVEVFHNGEWGAVCADRFDDTAATVVCQQLRKFGTARVVRNTFGQGSGLFWLDDVHCRGKESKITDCSHNGWGTHDCIQSQQVAIQCGSSGGGSSRLSGGSSRPQPRPQDTPRPGSAGSLRLVGGRTQNEGRVEIFQNGQWGTICDDGFGLADALVACRQMGKPYQMADYKHWSHFGEGRGPIWMMDRICSGNEHSLTSCGMSLAPEYMCAHSEDVGVVCKN